VDYVRDEGNRTPREDERDGIAGVVRVSVIRSLSKNEQNKFDIVVFKLIDVRDAI
jgi:hypothetical protein